MKNLASISIGLAIVGLAFGYAFNSLWLWLAPGLFWLAGQRRGWGWPAPPGLVFVVGAAALGVWQGRPAGWLLFSTIAALAAWDLDHFTRRARQAGHEEQAGLKQAHLRRLSIVAGLGLLLGAVALGLRVELNLGWAIFLGLAAIIGLSRVMGLIRGEGER